MGTSVRLLNYTIQSHLLKNILHTFLFSFNLLFCQHIQCWILIKKKIEHYKVNISDHVSDYRIIDPPLYNIP